MQAEISLSTVPEDPDDSLPSPLTASPVPPLSTASVKSEEFKSITSTSEPQSEAETNNIQQMILNKNHDNNGFKTNNFDEEESTTNLNTSGNNLSSLFDTENPWDLVPDQPAAPSLKKEVNISLSSSSNGLKMSSLVMSNSLKLDQDLEMEKQEKEISTDDQIITISTSTTTTNTTQSLPIGNNIMDDPFDAEWVSLALKQSNNQEIL